MNRYRPWQPDWSYAHDVLDVCRRLGLEVRGKSSACPACQAVQRSEKDRRLPAVAKDGRIGCFVCRGWMDPVDVVAWSVLGSRPRSGDDWERVKAACEDLDGGRPVEQAPRKPALVMTERKAAAWWQTLEARPSVADVEVQVRAIVAHYTERGEIVPEDIVSRAAARCYAAALCFGRSEWSGFEAYQLARAHVEERQAAGEVW